MREVMPASSTPPCCGSISVRSSASTREFGENFRMESMGERRRPSGKENPDKERVGSIATWLPGRMAPPKVGSKKYFCVRVQEIKSRACIFLSRLLALSFRSRMEFLSENIRGIEPDNVKNILWVAGFHKMILNIRLDYMLKSVPPQRMRKDLFKRRRAQVSGKIAQKSIHRAVVGSEACAVKRLTQSDCGSEMETPERVGSQRDARKKIHPLAERRRCEIRL